jgi:hypothetical protein
MPKHKSPILPSAAIREWLPKVGVPAYRFMTHIGAPACYLYQQAQLPAHHLLAVAAFSRHMEPQPPWCPDHIDAIMKGLLDHHADNPNVQALIAKWAKDKLDAV